MDKGKLLFLTQVISHLNNFRQKQNFKTLKRRWVILGKVFGRLRCSRKRISANLMSSTCWTRAVSKQNFTNNRITFMGTSISVEHFLVSFKSHLYRTEPTNVSLSDLAISKWLCSKCPGHILNCPLHFPACKLLFLFSFHFQMQTKCKHRSSSLS